MPRPQQIQQDRELWCRRCKKLAPHRWAPSPDAGVGWRCSECGGLVDMCQYCVCDSYPSDAMNECAACRMQPLGGMSLLLSDAGR